ncbi:MAG: sulfurtransferase [Betaproteobacteria bacterium]|nr:sulfurtransferase [Betaproteobacteria bacterium]
MSPLLNAEELINHLDDWLIVDCRYNLLQSNWGYEQYVENHLPGARFVHLDNDLSAAKTGFNGRHPLARPEQLITVFQRLGINHDSQVVVYDDMGGCFASRLWWSLKWLGFDKVAVLNGGLQAWKKIGGPLTSIEPEVAPGNFIGQPREGWVLQVDEIKENLESKEYLIIDARANDRFRGENETIDPVAGHIPGAINRPFVNNLDKEGLFKTASQIKNEFTTLLSAYPQQSIIHQCGSGVSACHNWLAMSYAGLEHSLKLYPGSWSEWASDPTRPVAR